MAVLNLSIFGYILTNLEQSDKAKKNTLHDRKIQNVQDVGHYKSLFHVGGIFLGKPYTWLPSGGYTFHIYDCSKFINIWLF